MYGTLGLTDMGREHVDLIHLRLRITEGPSTEVRAMQKICTEGSLPRG